MSGETAFLCISSSRFVVMTMLLQLIDKNRANKASIAFWREPTRFLESMFKFFGKYLHFLRRVPSHFLSSTFKNLHLRNQAATKAYYQHIYYMPIPMLIPMSIAVSVLPLSIPKC